MSGYYKYGPLVGSNVTDVTFEDGLKIVPNDSCNGCSTLTTAYFPKSVTTVKSYAFPTKGNPTDVYYEGTEEEWNNILIETNNDGLINATIHYDYKLEVVTYTATFIADGETLAVYEIEEGAVITVPDDPSKDGYTFIGWTPEIPSAMPAEDVTFTAVFEAIPEEPLEYKATFYVDNKVYESYFITEGEEITVPDSPAKNGYTFTGWSPAIPDAMPAVDIAFHATWDVNEYTITFIVDGSVYKEYTVDYGSDFPDPEAPSKEGYVFAGWDKVVPLTVPAEDMTLTALWEKLEPEETTANYTIDVYLMDTLGVYPSKPTASTSNIGIVGETVSVTAEEFEGFTTDTNKSILSATLAADGSTKLKVYYIRNIYTLTLNLGNETVREEYYYDSLLSEPETPVRDGYTFNGWDSALPEKMPANDLVLTALWKKNPDVTPEYKVGDIIEFGSYPQSEVTDATLLEELNALELEWISYGYYDGEGNYGSMEPGDYMQYADIEYGGEKYRAVEFIVNRPKYTYQAAVLLFSIYIDYPQYKNGYTQKNIYWFKYEPVQWRVLDPDEGLVLSEIIIDSQPYSNTIYDRYDAEGNTYYYNDEARTIYANDYKTSSIREWMNTDFYNTVFTEEEKTQLEEKVLDFTTCDEKTYTVTDKVFVLSSDEVANEDYGFETESDRCASDATEYAKAQGLKNRWWMLRSATGDEEDNVGCFIGYVGTGGSYTVVEMISRLLGEKTVCDTSMGIRPAIVMNLSAGEPSIEECKHTETSTVTVEPTCSESGYTYTVCESCGKIIDSIVNYEPKGHTESKVLILPTCTEDGYKYSVCSDCGEVLVEMTLFLATGHKALDWETTIEATCEEDGVKVKKCEKCGEVLETGSIPATGHKALDWETTKEATCEEDGVKVKKCENCEEVLETGSIPAAGHTSGDWEIIIEATVEAEGKKVKKCTKCGQILEEKSIPKLTQSKDEESGVIVVYPEDPDEPQITVEVKEERDETAFNLVDAEMRVADVKLFDITMYQDGKEIQPKSKVTVKIPLPEDYKAEYSYVYHINTKTLKIEKMETSVEVIDGKKYLVFETTHFSYYAIIEEVVINAEIHTPSTTEIKYGDSIWLHVDIEGDLPADAKIIWTPSNNNFEVVEVSEDGLSCKITPASSGTTTFTVSVVDANEKVLDTDTQDMNSKAGFFQKIIAFFKKLFGTTKTIPQIYKGIF